MPDKYNKIILGTAQFGMKYGVANKVGKIKSNEIIKILDFLKRKNFFSLDTASSYNSSEKEIGNFYKKRMIKFKIITKYSYSNKYSITRQYENSVKNLGYLPNTILAHSYKDYISKNFHKEIKNLKKKYPIKKVGVSLYNENELRKVLRFKKPDVVQVPVNILDKRFLKNKIVKILKKKSIKVLARSIFLQGLFFKKKTFIFRKFKNVKSTFKILENICKKESLTLSELSLIWTFKRRELDNIILGVDSLNQLKSNLNTLKKKISKGSLKEINLINLNNNIIIKPYLWKIK